MKSAGRKAAVGKVVASLVPLTLAVVLALLLAHRPAVPGPVPPQPPSRQLAVCRHAGCYAGPALAGTSRASLARFERATGSHATIVETYQAFGRPFPAAWCRNLTSRGILPLIQVNPRLVPVGAVAAGRYDAYLRSYAHEIGALGQPVALSFGHEMNGNWYPWGYHHTSPAVFVAAWRHIHQVVTANGGGRAVWVWTVDHNGAPGSPLVAPIRPWWPGGAYVDWVGIDAYYYLPRTTFRSAFGATIAAVRSFTDDPVLITETAVPGWGRQLRQIGNLFGNARAARLLGVIWYDQNGRRPWRLEGRTRALAAYRRSVAHMGKP